MGCEMYKNEIYMKGKLLEQQTELMQLSGKEKIELLGVMPYFVYCDGTMHYRAKALLELTATCRCPILVANRLNPNKENFA